MKLNLSFSRAGRYFGTRLNGGLTYFDRYIRQNINDSNFESSFENININFAYYSPLTDSYSLNDSDMDWYQKLPISRVLRNQKRIDITLKFPEISDHFDFEEHKKMGLNITTTYKRKGPSEAELAILIIDKFIAAIKLIASKMKSTDQFNNIHLTNILTSIKPEISAEFLKKITAEQSVKREDETLQWSLELRNKRKLATTDRNTRIRDLRVYHFGDLPIKALYPYTYQYSEIFLNLLYKNKLLCPEYHHLYIQVSTTRDKAIKKSGNLSKQIGYGIAVINYQEYLLKNEQEKSEIVFQLICDGLMDMAELDDLDKDVIQKTIEHIKIKGLDTELIHDVRKHKKYKLTISYFARSMEEQCPIFFNIKDKETNKKYRVKIGRADVDQIYYWLQKITLTQKKIKVKSSESHKANVWLKDKKRAMEFDLLELMKRENEVI